MEGDTGTSYVFDGTTFTAGPGDSRLPDGVAYRPGAGRRHRGLQLPGHLFAGVGSNRPEGSGDGVRGSTYKIYGTQFNGLSQAASFGDEYQTATNYPLVRITNNSTGHVFYAKTHDHSTMAVATGTKVVFTNFDVPAGMETGASSLVVVANGIPSQPVNITVN